VESRGIDPKWLPSKAPALCLCATETSLHTLYDERPLQLRDSRDDGEDRLTQRRAGVDLLAQGDELHVEMAEEFEALDQVPHGASEAVEGYDHDDIDAAGFHLDHQTVERWAAILRARDAVIDVLGDVFPSTSTAVVAEIAKLSLGVLVSRC